MIEGLNSRRWQREIWMDRSVFVLQAAARPDVFTFEGKQTKGGKPLGAG